MILTQDKDGHWILDLGPMPKDKADLLHDVIAQARVAVETYHRTGCTSGKIWVRVDMKKLKEPDVQAWHEGHVPKVRKGA